MDSDRQRARLGIPSGGWRRRAYIVIYESDTPTGKLFDVVLIAAIILSVAVVMLDSVQAYSIPYRDTFFALEWLFTILFTVEYVVRILSVNRPLRYVFSPLGIIDILAIIPTFLSLAVAGSQYLLTIRVLRVLRVFRVLKVTNYVSEADLLYAAMIRSRRKIAVFIFSVVTLVIILGSLMYLVEGAESGFTSIPRSVYWAIVTLTTVGYGDISPKTPLGQAFASLIMITGYGIIAVPTGIVTVEIANAARERDGQRRCPSCGTAGHERDARFCRDCGSALTPTQT